jgi:ABC-type transport system involved in cytochrome bd biosynthesis fused ATPase/permease subunit
VSGTLTRTAVSGVATFADLRLTRAGNTTLSATATGLRDATSALDPATEAVVLSALHEWLAQRTVVFITHRRAVAALASRAVVLRGGRVVADGPTDVVLSQPGPMQPAHALSAAH